MDFIITDTTLYPSAQTLINEQYTDHKNNNRVFIVEDAYDDEVNIQVHHFDHISPFMKNIVEEQWKKNPKMDGKVYLSYPMGLDQIVRLTFVVKSKTVASQV